MGSLKENEKMKKILKRGAGISLCAVLAGGLAAGTFEGVNRLTGWNEPQSVAAAEEEKLTLMKNSSGEETDDAGSENEKGSEVKGSLDVSDIAAAAMPSVVSITTKSVQEVENYYGFFYGYGYAPETGEQEVEGSGSGIIIGKNDSELLIATNYHVVEDADTLSVCFTDGNASEAKVKGFDSNKDLAVVSVALDDISDETKDVITIAKIGSSDDLVVGEQVVAIGNALGYGQSVTTGIVSAKNRRMDSDSGYFQTDDEENLKNGINLIQTDAAINPGNSGGALLNMKGEVVGINSAKLASTEVEGMGYAIAISDVENILENLMNAVPRDQLEDGEHGVLGIMGSTVSDEAIQVYGIPQGVFVSEVTEGGAAEKAGIQKNFVIVGFDGKTVTTIDQLIELLTYYEPGEEVDVDVQVPDGNSYREETITVTLMESTDDEDEKSSDKKSKKEEDSDAPDGDEEDLEEGPDEEMEEEEEDGWAGLFKNWDDSMNGDGMYERFFGIN